MGSSSSVEACDALIYSNEPNLVQWKPLFDGMMIPEADVGRYYTIFQALDTEQTGFVDTLSLFIFFEVKGNAFMERIFSLQNSNHSTLIDFRSFVLLLWNFCSLDHTKKNITGDIILTNMYYLNL